MNPYESPEEVVKAEYGDSPPSIWPALWLALEVAVVSFYAVLAVVIVAAVLLSSYFFFGDK